MGAPASPDLLAYREACRAIEGADPAVPTVAWWTDTKGQSWPVANRWNDKLIKADARRLGVQWPH